METLRLVQLVDCKLQILELLSRLARQQLEIIATGDMTSLLRLLSAKQTVMDQLQKVERQLDPFRDQHPDARAWPSPADRERCQQKVQRCNELVSEMMQLQRQAEAEMVRRRNDAAENLSGVHSASEARLAYGSELSSSVGLDLSTQG